MAPAYKFTYFNMRGLAETFRYLLKYGGIDFEDNRISAEDWPHLKDKTPFGQLPLLDHNGKQVCQHMAICRYLAKQVKLTGNDDLENLEIDSVVDSINDLRLKIMPLCFEEDEIKRKPMVETALEETYPYYLSRLEDIARKNNGYMALGRLTWADFYFVTNSPFLEELTGVDVIASYPNLRALEEKVNALPGIKEWIEVRPKTEH